MKCILALILIFFSLIGKAQVAYLDSTYSWTEWYTFNDYTIRYKLEFEPTLFNGKNYHEVLKSYREEGEDWIHTHEYIRNESPRIYWLHETEEKVLYDYSLKVGDEFEYPYGEKGLLQVTEQDSFTLRNGERRKLLKLTCELPYDTSYWIEGLPTLHGLFLDMVCEPFTDENPLIMCLHRNDTLLYRLPNVDSCFIKQNIVIPFLDDRYEWTEYIFESWGTESYCMRYTFDPEPIREGGIFFYERLQTEESTGNNWGHTQEYYGTDGNGKVYMSYFDNVYLKYDYSMEVNDTLDYLVVDQIDSITLENGERRKQLRLRCLYDDDPPTDFGYTYWIEGLGGTRGVYSYYNSLDACAFDANGVYLLCMTRNDTLLFDSPEFDSCWFLATATENPFEESLNLYPNPTTGIIHIESQFSPLQVMVYNGMGQPLFSRNENEIDLSEFPPGIYFFQIWISDQKNHFQRILKL